MKEIKKILMEINESLKEIKSHYDWNISIINRKIKECHIPMGLPASGKTTFGKSFKEYYFNFDLSKITSDTLLQRINHPVDKCYIDTFIRSNEQLNQTIDILNSTFNIEKFYIHYFRDNFVARKNNGIRRGFRMPHNGNEHLEDVKVNKNINYEIIYHEVYQENGRTIENIKRE